MHRYLQDWEMGDPMAVFLVLLMKRTKRKEEGSIIITVTTPMKMYENYHDNSEKHLLNGLVLPAGQTGIQDLNQTLDHLSSHPHTAPFIC